jgi:hypothetical protein
VYTVEIGDGTADVYEGSDADPARDCVTQERCSSSRSRAAAMS